MPKKRTAPRGPGGRAGRTVPTSSIVPSPLLNQNDVCAYLHIVRQTLWELRKNPTFPRAYHLSDGGAPKWRLADIDAWLEQRRADRVAG